MSLIKRTPGCVFALLFVALIAFYVHLFGREHFGRTEIFWMIFSGLVYILLLNIKYDPGDPPIPHQRS